jgi:hypothetical protein
MNSPDQSHHPSEIYRLPEDGTGASIRRIGDESKVDRIRGDNKTGAGMDTRQHIRSIYPRSIKKNRVRDEHSASCHGEQEVGLIQRFRAVEPYFGI